MPPRNAGKSATPSYLVGWKDGQILRFARAYIQNLNEDFYLPSEKLHAPGMAVAIELKGDPDV